MVAVGIFGSAMPICFAHGKDVTAPSIAGSVTGIVNSFTVLSGALLQPLVGLILDRRWDGTLLSGSRIYQEADYRAGFALIFASALVGFLLCLTRKRPNKGN